MSRRLLFLNGLAIIGVALNHSAAHGFIAMIWWADRYLPGAGINFDAIGEPAYFFLRFIEQLISFSVPAFIFVSGFFVAFAGGKTAGETWRVARSRSWGLAVPFVLWSSLTLVVRTVLGETFPPADWIWLILSGRSAEHYYFIPMLILLYMASPLLLWGAKRNARWLLIGAGILQAGTVALTYFPILGVESRLVDFLLDLTPSWFLTTGVFWFCLGLVVRLQLDRVSRRVERERVVLGVAWVALLAIGLVEWEWLLSSSGEPWIAYTTTVVDTVYAGVFILFFLSLDWARVRSSKRIGSLGAHSYGIYLTHGLVLLLLAKAIYHIAPGILAHPVIFVGILAAAGLVLPLVMMAATRRWLPGRFYHYVFG